ncbi:Glucan endo-1,3-beta-D-glucosidase [Ascochyta lentis]
MTTLTMKYTLLTFFLAPAAARIYTGFNYGAFWSHESNVKRYADFHHGFELAKNLTNTPVPFDSARLYTCITAGTQSDPTEAFQAAIDTGTNLLLGMWISPGASGQPNDLQIDNELAALEKGFQLHGQKLADLVIGLSIGNEDVYRFNNAAAGVGSDNLLLSIKRVRESIAASPYAKFMRDKPIGHTDTAMYAVVPGSDFTGMTAYPYWEGKSIDSAAQSFLSVLGDTQRRAGNTPVWISEMGWPINGTQKGEAVASVDNYQRYWDEVGCQVFGKYNTFWFELLQDSLPDQPDWGLLDTKTYQPRIRDLSCGGRGKVSASGTVAAVSTTRSQTTTLSTFPSTSPAAKTLPSTPPTIASNSKVPLHPTTTISIITSNTSATPASTPASICITMLDLQQNGIYIPVAVPPLSGIKECAPPPRFSGSPLTMLASEDVVSFDLYAPSPTPATSTVDEVGESATTTTTPTPVLANPPCTTLDGVIHEVYMSDGMRYLGKSVAACTATAIPFAPVSTTPTAQFSTMLVDSTPPSSAISSVLLGPAGAVSEPSTLRTVVLTRPGSMSMSVSTSELRSTLQTVIKPTMSSDLGLGNLGAGLTSSTPSSNSITPPTSTSLSPPLPISSSPSAPTLSVPPKPTANSDVNPVLSIFSAYLAELGMGSKSVSTPTATVMSSRTA